MNINATQCSHQLSHMKPMSRRKLRKNSLAVYYVAIGLLALIRPHAITAYSASSRLQVSKLLHHNPATFTTPNSLSNFDRSYDNLENTRQPRQALLYARNSNVEEIYAVKPKKQIIRKDETIGSPAKLYTILNHERRKQITKPQEIAATATIPTTTTTTSTTTSIVDNDDELISQRKRSPRMTVNLVNPTTTVRRSRTSIGSGSKPVKEIPRISRSSTMPGFSSSNTKKQRAFRDSVRLLEERTGRKYIDTPERKQHRRKLNGEAMYKNSPSVPDSLVQFASEIHQEKRITRQEEIELGEKTQEAIRLQHLFQSLEDRLGREPTDDEWCAAAGKINMAAIGQAIEDGIEAKNKLVTSNLRMVQSVVNTYIRNGLSSQYNAGDLMQEGIMALIRAAEKFEPDRGWKFSTYAMYWVRASVKRSQIYQSRIIPVPQRLTENHKRLKRMERDIIISTGRKPSMKELGATVGMSEEQVSRCMSAMAQRCYSLDQEMHNPLKPNKAAGDSNKDTMIEIVESKSCKINVQNDYDRVQRAMLREDLMETLRRYLPPQEAEVLLARYGFVSGPDLSEVNSSGNDETLLRNNQIGEDKPPTIAELSRMFNIKPDKLRRMIDQSLKHLNGVGLDEWLAFERELP